MKPLKVLAAAAALVLLGGTSAAFAAFHDTTTTTVGTLTAAAEWPPVPLAVPSILGIAQVGSGLDTDGGAFKPTPTSRVYTWLRCDAAGANCTAITAGATSPYSVSLSDLSATIRVKITPYNGSTAGTPATSEPTPAATALINTAPTLVSFLGEPAITGTTTVGQVLTGSTGSWLGANTITQQWLRCDGTGANCVAIAGQTATTRTLVVADRGARLRLKVTATSLVSTSNTVISPASGVIG